jgi:hypothetical protein
MGTLRIDMKMRSLLPESACPPPNPSLCLQRCRVSSCMFMPVYDSSSRDRVAGVFEMVQGEPIVPFPAAMQWLRCAPHALMLLLAESRLVMQLHALSSFLLLLLLLLLSFSPTYTHGCQLISASTTWPPAHLPCAVPAPVFVTATSQLLHAAAGLAWRLWAFLVWTWTLATSH